MHARTAPQVWLATFFWVFLAASFCQWTQAQGPEREGRFGKVQLQNALQGADVADVDSAGSDFYEKYIQGKTVLINFFYTQCDQGVCDQVMGNLTKVQRLLGRRLGRNVFIVSITLDPEHDTREVLKAYARNIGAKPGWSFLRGSVAEVSDLRENLGLANVSPEFLRRLKTISPDVARKTIETRSPTEWDPKSLRALVGERVVWKVGEDSTGTHGLRITNWDVVKQFVEVEPVEGQEPFDTDQGQSDRSTATAGKVFVRFKIRSEPPVPTKITYDCMVHGGAMSGDVLLGQQHTGMLYAYNDRTNRHSLISVDATPTEILETLARFAGGVGPEPADAAASASSEITVDAGPGIVWTSGGNSSTPAVPLKVPAKKGQTVVFRHVDPGRQHGLLFTTTDLVLLQGEAPGKKPNAVLKQTDTLDRYGKDIPGAATPQDLARFEVLRDITTVPEFLCTVHLDNMAGSIEPAPAGPTTGAPLPEITVDAGPGIVWRSGGNSSTPAVPLKVPAKKGQTVVFRHADPGRQHGLLFTTTDLVLLQGEAPGKKPNAVLKQTDTLDRYGKDIPGAATPQELARFEVVQDIATAPEFLCTVHLANMAGTVEPAPAGPTAGAPLPEITIDAGPGIAWTSGGNSSTPAAPLKVPAKKGQTLVFRHADAGRPHGLLFTTATLVLLRGDAPGMKPNAVLKQTDTLDRYGKDIPGAATPQELARFEVLQDITTAPEFLCTVHLANMAGTVEPAPTSAMDASTSARMGITLSPSVQRRLLRFANRAYGPEDLMKAPQEMRMKSEHLPREDSRAGFSRAVARSLIERRPLQGYRDVRECLPSYEQPGGSDSLQEVLDSIGPKQFGEWKEVVRDTPPLMHAALLRTGEVLFLTDSTDTVLWNPASSSVTVLSGAATGLTDNLFCSGHSFLSDGRLLVVGGGGSGPVNRTSMHGWIFDPGSNTWTRTGNDMTFQRWYPSLVTLGRDPEQVLVAAGLTPSGPAARMEIYSEATNLFQVVTATGPTGDLLFPGTYPSLRSLPSGEILHVATGWGVSGAPCDQSADGASVEPTAIFRFSSPSVGSWRTLGTNNRLKGMAVTLFEPTIQSFVVGGGSTSLSGTAATMNLATLSPTWDPAFPLLEARVHPNLVVLPDGTVFVCGGMESSAPTPPDGGRCELYDPRPAIPTLTEMDEMIRFRHYHSVALLLPDGRVMAAGGAARGGCTVSEQNTIEVFSPPYLFKGGTRPVITTATKTVEHGGTIEIQTPAASQIQRVVLARPGAVTHQTDSEQRVIPLSFKVTGPGTIEATAPGGPGANPLAPRGHYLLFIFDQQGVPSVSTWVRLVGRGGVAVSPANEVSGDKRAARAPQANQRILEAALVDRDGKARSLREFAGRPHIVVLIEGAFCKLCMSQLAEFQQQLDASRVPIVVVTPNDDLPALDDVPFNVFADPDLRLFKGLQVFRDEPLHGTFVFNARDEIVLKDIGTEPYTDFAAIRKALKISVP